MRLGKIFLLMMLWLCSCGEDSKNISNTSFLEETKNPSNDNISDSDVSEDEAIPEIQTLRWYPKNIWQRNWSKAVISKVDEVGLSTQEVDIGDLLALNCLGYNVATERQKSFFWLTLIASVASQESAFNPNTRYYERSLGEWSEGLMQLSVSNQWHGEECGELDRQSILDPHANLKCSVRILKNQLVGGRARPANQIFPSRSYYWSTLTVASKKERVITFFKKHLNHLPFCKGG